MDRRDRRERGNVFRRFAAELLTVEDAARAQRVERATTASGEVVTSQLNAPIPPNLTSAVDAVSVRTAEDRVSTKTDLAGHLTDFASAIVARFISPMTTRGDMIRRGATVAERLPLGTAGQVLTSNGTDPNWAAPTGMVSPMTTRGDMIRRSTSGPERVALGTSGQVLTSNGSDPNWATPPSSLSNPMTTPADLIVGGTAGAPARLGKGTAGQVLTVDSGTGLLAWATVPGHLHVAADVSNFDAAATAAVRDAPRTLRNMATYANTASATVSTVGMLAPVLSGVNTWQSFSSPGYGDTILHTTPAQVDGVASVTPPAFNVARPYWTPRLSVSLHPRPDTYKRVWVGFFASSPALTSAPIFGHAGFLYVSGASSAGNWQCSSADGTTQSQIDSGVAVAAPQDLEVELNFLRGDIRYWINGALVATKTTNQPLGSLKVGYVISVTALEAVAKSINWGRIDVGYVQ